MLWYLQVFSFTFKLPPNMSEEELYDVFRLSCYIFELHSDMRNKVMLWHPQEFSLTFRITFPYETQTYVMISWGILINLQITFQPGEWGHGWCLQVFTLDIWITFRHETQGQIWCLQVFSVCSTYLQTWDTKICIISSGTLIYIQIVFL